MNNSTPIGRKVVLVDACRIPFLKSGTAYGDMMAYQLGAKAIKGLLNKTSVKKALIDRVIMGTVIHNVTTSNIAREAALIAGLSSTTPAHTVTQACISANAAIAQGADLIRLGHADVVIAGGTDSVSDIPITFRKKMRKKLFAAQKIKSLADSLKFMGSLRPSDFKPEVPDITEFTTGVTMGQDCELMASRFNISREAQDQFAARSHQLADKSHKYLQEQIVPVETEDYQERINRDNGVRGTTTDEKLAKLRPAFDKRNGSLTAGNSSFLTDGAAVVMLMSEDKARELDIPAKARIGSYVFTGRDPKEELLLGPAYATPKVLEAAGMELDDIDVIEFHEAFAAQILANIQCLESDEFARKQLGRTQKVGTIDMDKFNCWGGSLSIGHPFGATGARLVATAADRMIAEDGQTALIAACAAGGHGHAMLLERLK